MHALTEDGCDEIVIVGALVVTVKSVALVAVLPPIVTVIVPVVAPVGTVVVILVDVLAVTTEVVLLNFTVLLADVALKFVPVIVTAVVVGPLVGVKLVIVGNEGVFTVKSVALVAVLPPTVTVIFPVVAPAGTVVVILVAVLAVTTAVVLLNFTVLFTGVALKFVPVIVTTVAAGPLAGVKLVIVGNVAAPTTKSVALVAVRQFTVTEILPVIAPLGTVVVMLVVVLAVTTAVLSLKNFTTLFAGLVLKFVPVMVTDAPIAPEAGLKDVIVGTSVVLRESF